MALSGSRGGGGGTTTRVLETVFNNHGKFVEEYGNTDIFIYPGYKFSAVDQYVPLKYLTTVNI